MAFDAEHRLVVSVVPGERTAENVVAVVEDFQRRTGGRVMNLITTDGYPAYEDGDPGGLRGDGHAAPDRQAGASQGPVQGRRRRT